MNKSVLDDVQDEKSDNQQNKPINKVIFDKIVRYVSKMCPRCVQDVSKLLITIKNAPIAELGFNDLTDTIGINSRRKYLRNVITPAIEAGLIERTIPDKPTSRNQKYRLTDKGRQLLNSDEKHV